MTLQKDAISPYQGIDLLLGADKRATAKPVAGYAVTYADIGCIGLFNSEDAMKEATAKAVSKYAPQVLNAWIHTEGNRQHWSPR